MKGRRTVVSVSVSPRNRDAAVVAEALAELGIPLTHGGGQILAWAAAHLTAPPPMPVEPPEDDVFGVDFDARLDDF